MADPVAWWKLDESSGSSAADSSGNGNTGTFYGTPAWADGGASFNGSSYIGVTSSTTTNITGDFTLSVWVKTSQAAASDQYPLIIMKNGGAPQNGYAIYLHYGTADARWFGEIKVGGTAYNVYGTSDVADGAWHHLAFQREGTTLRAYEDGALANSSTAVSTTISNAVELRFGRSLFGAPWDYYLVGGVDDVRIYNSALTAGEIGAIYSPSVTLAPGSGLASAVGNSPHLTTVRAPTSGAISATGQPDVPPLTIARVLTAGGTITASGAAPALARYFPPTSATVTASGNAPTATRAIAPSTGTVSAQGAQPTATKTLLSSAGSASAAGNAPALATGTALVPETGVGQAVGGTVARTFFMASTSGQASAASAASAALAFALSPQTGAVLASGSAPELEALDPSDLNPPSGLVQAIGNQPSLTLRYTPTSGRATWIGARPVLPGGPADASICTPPLLNKGLKLIDMVAYLT